MPTEVALMRISADKRPDSFIGCHSQLKVAASSCPVTGVRLAREIEAPASRRPKPLSRIRLAMSRPFGKLCRREVQYESH